MPTVPVYVKSEIYRYLYQVARERGVPVATVVRWILEEHVKKYGRVAV